MRRLLALRKALVAGALGVVLAACSTVRVESDDDGSSMGASDQEIVVVVKITGIGWFDRMATGIAEARDQLGIEASMIGPEDAATIEQDQIALIDDLIARKVPAIGVVPQNPAGLDPTLKKARAAGIVVLTHESPDQPSADWDIETVQTVSFVETVFQRAAEFMGGSGQYALFVGGGGVQNLWADIGKEYFASHFGTAFELVEAPEGGDRTVCAEDATACKTATEWLLTTYPDLRGIIAFGSQGPIGAALTLQELGRTDVVVVGTALPSQACEFLVNDFIKEAYLSDPRDAGFALVAIAQRLLSGQTDPSGEYPGLGSPIVDTGGKHIIFDRILVITPDNCRGLHF
jgi:simple sugar transport system substrate-binding protein